MTQHLNKKQQALADQIEGLAELDLADLRAQWAGLYKIDPPVRISRTLLELGIAHHLQEKVLGGLGAIDKRHLKQHAHSLQVGDKTAPSQRSQTLSPAPNSYESGVAIYMRFWFWRMDLNGKVNAGAHYL